MELAKSISKLLSKAPLLKKNIDVKIRKKKNVDLNQLAGRWTTS